MQLVTFKIGGKTGAFPTEGIECIIRAVHCQPVPEATLLLGVINFHGVIAPVVSLRRYFQLSERQVQARDYMIVHSTPEGKAVFVVDELLELSECPDSEIRTSGEIFEGLTEAVKLGRLADGCLVITHPQYILRAVQNEIRKAQAISGEID